MGLEPHDIDLCTTATPEEMAGEEGLKGGFLRADAGVEKVRSLGLADLRFVVDQCRGGLTGDSDWASSWDRHGSDQPRTVRNHNSADRYGSRWSVRS